MANEMSILGSIIVTATNFSERIEPGAILVDLTDLTVVSGVKNVSTLGTGTEIIPTTGSGLTNGGVYFFRNLDANNSVQVGQGPSGSFDAIMLLKPGEYAIGRLPSDMPSAHAVFAVASGGSVDLQFVVFDGA
jgi:hypothetical protein